jgi:pimeloyl-ACP methyl ester carboxylesterase
MLRVRTTQAEYALLLVGAGGAALRLASLGHLRALVLLLFAATAYAVLPAGARAAIAVTLGVLAVFGGFLAVLELRWDDGLDAFGLLLLPLGLGMVAAAVLALLSRRRTTWPRRAGRWILTVASALVLALYVIVPSATAIWVTGKPRIAVRAWDVPHRDVTLTARDGVRLAAWYVPSRNRAGIVLVHGSGGSRDGLKRHAALLARHGFAVLLFDARGRGDSGGRSSGFGWGWEADVEAAVDYLEQHGVRRVGTLGLSTGAEVAVTAAAHDARIRAVVADGLQARTVEDFEHGAGSDLPYWWATLTAVHLIRGPGQPAPLAKLVPEIAPRPFLIVAGQRDKGDSAFDDVWAKADGRPNVLWKVDAAHTKALATYPAQYERRVVGFFDRALHTTS